MTPRVVSQPQLMDGPTLRPRPQPEAGVQPAAELPVIQPDGGSEASRRCKVEGCGKLLKTEKRFYQRARCCMEHAFAAEVSLGGGIIRRFCQQCCCFHALDAFESDNRSCRRRLDAHNTRRQQQNRTFGFHRRRRPGAKAAAAKKAAASRACASSPGGAPAPAEHAGSDAAVAADASGSGGSGGSLSEQDSPDSDAAMAKDAAGVAPAAQDGKTAPLDAAAVPRRQRSKRCLSAQLPPANRSVASNSRRRTSADAASARLAAQAAILQLQQPQPQPQLHQNSQSGHIVEGLMVPPAQPALRLCSRSEPSFLEHQTWQQDITMCAAELPLPPPLPTGSEFGAATSASEMQWQPASDLPSLSSVHVGSGGNGGGTAAAAVVASCCAPEPLLVAGPWAQQPGGGAGSIRLQRMLQPQARFLHLPTIDSACMADLPVGWHPPTLRDDAAGETLTQPLHAASLSDQQPLPPPLPMDGAASRWNWHSLPAGMLSSDLHLRDAAQLGMRSLSAPEPEAAQLQQQLSGCAAAVVAHASGGFALGSGFQLPDWEVAQLELPLPLHPPPRLRRPASDVEGQPQPSSAQHLSFGQPRSWQDPGVQPPHAAAPLPGAAADSAPGLAWVRNSGSVTTRALPRGSAQRSQGGGSFTVAEAATLAAAEPAATAAVPPAGGMQHVCNPHSDSFPATMSAAGPLTDGMQHACDPHGDGGGSAATAATGCLPAAEAAWPPHAWGPDAA